MYQWALKYAEMGLRVFPLQVKDKKPLPGSRGFKDATSDKEQLRKWWGENPNYNIGIATGEMAGGGFLTVIDIDNDEAKGKSGSSSLQAWLSDNNHQMPQTLVSKTGRGGFHYFYKTKEAFRNRTELLLSVDVRGDGGYIVAPPSIHPNGTCYKWATSNEIADADQAVLDLLNTQEKKEKQAGGIVTEGTRNDTLFRFGCSLQEKGLSDAAILQEMKEYNRAQFVPPLSNIEVEATYKGVIQRYQKGLPAHCGLVEDFAEYEKDLKGAYPFVVLSKKTDGRISYKTSPALLAEYVRGHLSYYFSDTRGNSPAIYFYNETMGIYENISVDKFKSEIINPVREFGKTYKTSLETARVIDDTYKLLRADGEKRIDLNRFNSDENIIVFQNGVLHLDTMQLLPHSPKVLSTIQIPCDWVDTVGEMDCFTFDKYIHDLADGDVGINKLLWQIVGAVISNVPGYKAKSAFFLYGVANSGKSKFWELLSRLVGERNTASVEISALENRFGTFQLLHKRLAGSGEMSYSTAKEMKMFKSLTGGDNISFEAKGENAFTGKYRGWLLFCGNALPGFGGDRGDHVYNRMIIIPCKRAIPPEKQDKNLIDKIYEQRSAICHHAVKALKKFIANGYSFDVPDVCKAEREEYKKSNDNVFDFLQECTEDRTTPAYMDAATTGRVYTSYAQWCKERGEKSAGRNGFRRSLCQYYKVDNIDNLILPKSQGNYYYKFTLNQEGRRILNRI